MRVRWFESRPVAWLGRIAYSVFLIHFPVCMVVNAAWTRFLPTDPWTSLAGIVVAWGCSVAAGALFYRLVESRVDAHRGARRRALFAGAQARNSWSRVIAANPVPTPRNRLRRLIM